MNTLICKLAALAGLSGTVFGAMDAGAATYYYAGRPLILTKTLDPRLPPCPVTDGQSIGSIMATATAPYAHFTATVVLAGQTLSKSGGGGKALDIFEVASDGHVMASEFVGDPSQTVLKLGGQAVKVYFNQSFWDGSGTDPRYKGVFSRTEELVYLSVLATGQGCLYRPQDQGSWSTVPPASAPTTGGSLPQ